MFLSILLFLIDNEIFTFFPLILIICWDLFFKNSIFDILNFSFHTFFFLIDRFIAFHYVQLLRSILIVGTFGLKDFFQVGLNFISVRVCVDNLSLDVWTLKNKQNFLVVFRLLRFGTDWQSGCRGGDIHRSMSTGKAIT